MDCSQLVDALVKRKDLTSLLARDATGSPAIYQIIAPAGELFPRIAVFEVDRYFTAFADDVPLIERTKYRLDIFARENVLRPVNAALHNVLVAEGFYRTAQEEDNYIPELEVMTKSVVYTYDDHLNLF